MTPIIDRARPLARRPPDEFKPKVDKEAKWKQKNWSTSLDHSEDKQSRGVDTIPDFSQGIKDKPQSHSNRFHAAEGKPSDSKNEANISPASPYGSGGHLIRRKPICRGSDVSIVHNGKADSLFGEGSDYCSSISSGQVCEAIPGKVSSASSIMIGGSQKTVPRRDVLADRTTITLVTERDPYKKGWKGWLADRRRGRAYEHKKDQLKKLARREAELEASSSFSGSALSTASLSSKDGSDGVRSSVTRTSSHRSEIRDTLSTSVSSLFSWFSKKAKSSGSNFS
jgi:hypothetical protein